MHSSQHVQMDVSEKTSIILNINVHGIHKEGKGYVIALLHKNKKGYCQFQSRGGCTKGIPKFLKN